MLTSAGSWSHLATCSWRLCEAGRAPPPHARDPIIITMGVLSREEERWQCNGRQAPPRRLHASPASHFHGKARVPAGGNNKKLKKERKEYYRSRWSADAGSLLQCTISSRSRMRPHIGLFPTIAGAPTRPHPLVHPCTERARTAGRGGRPPRRYPYVQ